jgi:hypothetical protein
MLSVCDNSNRPIFGNHMHAKLWPNNWGPRLYTHPKIKHIIAQTCYVKRIFFPASSFTSTVTEMTQPLLFIFQPLKRI